MTTETPSFSGKSQDIQDLLRQLEGTTQTITTLKNPPLPTLNSLIATLESFNQRFAQNNLNLISPLSQKQWIEKELREGIEAAVKAIDLFKQNQGDKTGAAQKNAHQALISLVFSKLSKEVQNLRKNLIKAKERKNWKNGVKVEKVGKLGKRMRDQNDEDHSTF